MSLAADILSWAFMLTGSAVIIVGSVGLLRMPDFYTRSHAAGMTDTLGAALILAGLAVEAGWSLNLARLVFIFIFLLFTGPTACHALTRAAFASGLRPWTRGGGGAKD